MNRATTITPQIKYELIIQPRDKISKNLIKAKHMAKNIKAAPTKRRSVMFKTIGKCITSAKILAPICI